MGSSANYVKVDCRCFCAYFWNHLSLLLSKLTMTNVDDLLERSVFVY